MTCIDAIWLATEPLDMRAGTETTLARVIAVFGAAKLHSAYLFANRRDTVLKSAGLAADLAPYGTVTVNAVFIACAIPLSILLPRLNTRSILLVMLATGIVVAFGLGLAGQQWPLVFVLIGLAGFGIGGQQLALNYLIITS
ncbi:IS66 family insertion sequence element accessory protein TnpB [Pseudomonas putida]|uniref:IS66 family insertion sequence element accessory protein TnpB n=1 Tax=Pseudomonas putida TaxID=303 RepID=UPI002363999D|nr:IS66 family insertion sequence element accessory protein TnpB [Pseudomonas putida]MDD2067738.1 IS66 family insertion sequence element accessory protein TnpB [Pseudomonas putida]HDS1738373.1 IS66 family insertion sequence element accessory protein TnpB [Pseudomonas putida]